IRAEIEPVDPDRAPWREEAVDLKVLPGMVDLAAGGQRANDVDGFLDRIDAPPRGQSERRGEVAARAQDQAGTARCDLVERQEGEPGVYGMHLEGAQRHRARPHPVARGGPQGRAADTGL